MRGWDVEQGGRNGGGYVTTARQRSNSLARAPLTLTEHGDMLHAPHNYIHKRQAEEKNDVPQFVVCKKIIDMMVFGFSH